MPIFEYQATDSTGAMKRGVTSGVSMDAVAQELSKQGLALQSLNLASQPKEQPQAPPVSRPTFTTDESILGVRSKLATDVFGPLVGQVSLTSLQFFFQQLGTMLKAGVGVAESLDTLSTQAQSPKLKHIIRELRNHVTEGRSISFGLSRYPEVFSPLILNLVHTGESGGFLDESLFMVAGYIKQDMEIRMNVRKATLWPKITVAASIVIITSANMVIASVAPGGQQIVNPLMNPVIIIPLLILVIGGFIAFRIGLRNPQAQFAWHSFTSNLPGIAKVVRQFAMAKFGRAFGVLYKGGVAIPTAMQLAADSSGNEAIRQKIYAAIPQLSEGRGIHETMASTGAFNPIVLDMARTGEATGNMDQMMNSISEFYEAEAMHGATKISMIFGVVVMLLVACYVLYIVVS